MIIVDRITAQLSSEMRSLTLPILQRSADFSCHQDKGTFKSTLIDVESDNPIRLQRDGRVWKIGQRQLTFVRTFLAHLRQRGQSGSVSRL